MGHARVRLRGRFQILAFPARTAHAFFMVEFVGMVCDGYFFFLCPRSFVACQVSGGGDSSSLPTAGRTLRQSSTLCTASRSTIGSGETLSECIGEMRWRWFRSPDHRILRTTVFEIRNSFVLVST